MKDKQTYDLYIFKKTTFLGICIGFAICLFSIFESDFNTDFIVKQNKMKKINISSYFPTNQT